MKMQSLKELMVFSKMNLKSPLKKRTKNEVDKIVTNAISIYNKMRPHFSCELMTPEVAHLKGKFKYKKWGKFFVNEYWN